MGNQNQPQSNQPKVAENKPEAAEPTDEQKEIAALKAQLAAKDAELASAKSGPGLSAAEVAEMTDTGLPNVRPDRPAIPLHFTGKHPIFRSERPTGRAG